MAFETTFVPLTVEELPALAAAKKDGGWRFVQLLAVNTEDGIDLIYSFMKDNLLETHEIKGLQKGTSVPSITDTTCSAWMCRASPSTSAAISTRWRRRSP